MSKESKHQINISVTLDENKIPSKIQVDSTEEGFDKLNTPSMLLSLWDSENLEALKIDLWIKQMPVDEMKMFIHQTLDTLGDTYKRATSDEEMGAVLKEFSSYFAQKLQLYK
ncbi:MAG: gliding motility protein GldC [Flavobacteriaceae bacterium]|nr:gliding motility protein GldC [Flavobacteriaceae bacterium]MCY4215562.1 gliding motility protein GldC [Flavobacteriaceae bacterium]MCY4253342.1 gliding motility protein GldC [Flavobacteriaceae bacterium]